MVQRQRRSQSRRLTAALPSRNQLVAEGRLLDDWFAPKVVIQEPDRSARKQ